jgi:hypothetical protein
LWTKLQRGERAGLLPLADALLPRIAGTWRGAERAARCAMALLAFDARREDEARRLLAEVEGAGFDALERDEHFLFTCATAADVIHRLGDRRRAESLARVLAPYAHLLAFHDLLRTFAGSVATVIGELLLTLGRTDEAIARFEAGLALEGRAGARAAELSTRVRLARALDARGARGDSRRGAELLRAVAAEAPRLGIDCRVRFGVDAQALAERPALRL